jgi:hypothetical protein
MSAPRGIRHGKAVHTDSVVKAVRDDYYDRGIKFKELSEKYGISINTVKDWVLFQTRVVL